MTPRPAAPDDVVAAVRALPAGLRFVGIDGFGASGKTTLAETVSAAVPDVVVIHVDDFWGPRIPEWDWTRFRAQVVLPLLAGSPARYQAWDWDLDIGGEWVDIPAGRTVVVEGVSSTRREAGVDWDLSVWVTAPREQRLARAVERDGEAMLPRWLDDWMPSEDAYAEREQPQQRVDLIVDGSGLD